MTLSVGDMLGKLHRVVVPNPEATESAYKDTFALVEGELQRIFEVERIDYIKEWNQKTMQQDTKFLVKPREIE